MILMERPILWGKSDWSTRITSDAIDRSDAMRELKHFIKKHKVNVQSIDEAACVARVARDSIARVTCHTMLVAENGIDWAVAKRNRKEGDAESQLPARATA